MVQGIKILIKRSALYDYGGTEQKYLDRQRELQKLVLGYGEPLYLTDRKYIIIGDGEHTVQ